MAWVLLSRVNGGGVICFGEVSVVGKMGWYRLIQRKF